MSFGREYGFLDEERDVEGLIEDSYIGNLYFAPATQTPWIDELLDKNPLIRLGPRPLLKGVTYTANIIKKYINQRPKGQVPQKSVPYLLEKYWHMRQGDSSIDDQKLIHWMLPPILAGGDTTASCMRAVIYYLAKSPTARQKLFTELDDSWLSAPAQWKNIRNLPYLDAVIRESLRVNPGISLMFERVVPDVGFTLPDGRFVPSGTIIGVNPMVTNRDKGIFGEDVDSFCPERWLQADGESEEAFSSRLRRMRETCDFVFGAGGRICLGRNMALLETYKLMATLYSQFDVSYHLSSLHIGGMRDVEN
jgi:cytochrome P450